MIFLVYLEEVVGPVLDAVGRVVFWFLMLDGRRRIVGRVVVGGVVGVDC